MTLLLAYVSGAEWMLQSTYPMAERVRDNSCCNDGTATFAEIGFEEHL